MLTEFITRWTIRRNSDTTHSHTYYQWAASDCDFACVIYAVIRVAV